MDFGNVLRHIGYVMSLVLESIPLIFFGSGWRLQSLAVFDSKDVLPHRPYRVAGGGACATADLLVESVSFMMRLLALGAMFLWCSIQLQRLLQAAWSLLKLHTGPQCPCQLARICLLLC